MNNAVNLKSSLESYNLLYLDKSEKSQIHMNALTLFMNTHESLIKNYGSILYQLIPKKSVAKDFLNLVVGEVAFGNGRLKILDHILKKLFPCLTKPTSEYILHFCDVFADTKIKNLGKNEIMYILDTLNECWKEYLNIQLIEKDEKKLLIKIFVR